MLHLLLGIVLAIDPMKSTSEFSVKHIFIERVKGTVPIVSGTIDVPAGSMIPTMVTAVLDPKRFKTDEPDRDAAMQGPDWFETSKYPTWSFTSTNIAQAPGGFTMDGMLTIRGVAQPEHLIVVTSGDPSHPHYHAIGHIDRKAFGMVPTRLDAVIGNPVDITLDIATQP